MARIELLRELRLGVFDVLVGINLLREGLDLPEVALVAILDADKEGFLRSASSLIQTMGRAARNVDGRVVMYADRVTDSMTAAIGETQRRRARQIAYNQANGIDPTSIIKSVTDILERVRGDAFGSEGNLAGLTPVGGSRRQKGSRERGGLDARSAAAEMAHAIGPDADELSALIHRLDAEMVKAAEELRFEEAALIRDEVNELRALLNRDPVDGSPVLPGSTADVEAPAPA
jgi:excinuclease ABC subunit B